MPIRSSFLLLALSAALFGADTAPASFEAAALKHTGSTLTGARSRQIKKLEYRGVKLSGEVPLSTLFEFGYSPLVSPWKSEQPDWMAQEYYEIDATAPAGTTIDRTRAMVRTLLADRLGLQYHVTDRVESVYVLVKTGNDVKLPPATEPEPNPGAMQMGAFQKKSATMADFARFLTSLKDMEVVDRTGLTGQYKFEVNWSKEIGDTRGQYGPHGDPAIVNDGLKKLGLKLVSRKEPLKVVVVDKVNKEPAAINP